ncbi:hypothetical protein [Nitratidesulfovibrio sp.]|uniref:hypothetical protein n=1 Tax=Nitratidesulfovibrio sp. TaxID=2802297 RepID=UPI00333FB477
MKLVIAEYLRTLKERDELDRLLPDLLIEMGYVPIARPQTGNRQYGVDLAARGTNPNSDTEELLLAVIKKGDIGRTEWDGGDQSVRQSINEILDVYLTSHVEPQDKGKHIHIVVVTNGELKQVVQASWTGFVSSIGAKAEVDFWGIDRLAALIERHLLDEHVFRDSERKLLRRSLALSGDSDYDRRDLHRLFLQSLDLTNSGGLSETPKTGKALVKAMRIVNLSAHAFASWALAEGDSRQGLLCMERALLWAWHRIQLCGNATRLSIITDVFPSFWIGYCVACKEYFERLQPYCYTKDSLSKKYYDSAELSMLSFEVIGVLSSIGLSQILINPGDASPLQDRAAQAEIIADAIIGLIHNNKICGSPCLDRHSNDISLALTLLLLAGRKKDAVTWLKTLIRNVDYSYKTKRHIPVCSDSIDDLIDEGGWGSNEAAARLMNSSWTLATLAGWAAILKEKEHYTKLATGCKNDYPDTCVQLWHPDKDIYSHLYFCRSHFQCGASEAPIILPDNPGEWIEHMKTITRSPQEKIYEASPALQTGLAALDIIACRHFLTPVPPFFWYRLACWADSLQSKPSEIGIASP